jgi:EthD domain
MFKVLAFLTKREDIEMQVFVDYYENHHVPLIRSLALTPIVYKRRYIVRGEELTTEAGAVDFDVVTELGFPDRAAFLAWMAQLSGPGAGEQVAADEAKFLDRSRTRAYVVEEHVTSGREGQQ